MKSRDKFSLYNHIVLNEGAYFYKKGSVVLNNDKINSIFDTVISDIKYNIWTVVKRQEETEGLSYSKKAYCSLLIFSSSSNPTFFDFEKEHFPKDLQENKISYLLIVEMKEYVIIVKKNISRLSSFTNQLQVIDGKTLGGVLVNSDTAYQQLKLSSMNMNEDAMRNKSYEANDLKNSMPMFGANQNIVNTARFVTDDELCTLNISTSRISKFGNKKNIIDLLVWMDDFVENLDNYTPSSNFLGRFALPALWKDVHDKLTPVSLLINLFELMNYIQSLDDKDIYRSNKNNKYHNATDLFKHFVKSGVKCQELADSSTTSSFQCKGNMEGIGIKIGKLGIRITASKTWETFVCKANNGDYIKLVDVVNKSACFSVGFNDYSYIYNAHRVYQNAKIDQDLDSILSTFETYSRMNTVVSEKGRNDDKGRTEFTNDCVFDVVEKDIFPNADYLICDDMGNEWADHIAIQGNTISFIHSKCYNTTALSASKFQEVIGQAVKNIGNLNPDDDALDRKKISLDGYMKDTLIKKCRKGMAQEFVDNFKALRINPNLTKEVCIAIDFISKSQLTEVFSKLKNRENFKQKNSVVQMVWLLNGFINTCKEADLHCRIFCKP